MSSVVVRSISWLNLSEQKSLPRLSPAGRTRFVCWFSSASKGGIFIGLFLQTVLLLGAELGSKVASNTERRGLAPDVPLLAPHLQLWLRADALPLKDGAQVFRWPDHSGQNRDASATIGVHEGVGTPPTFLKTSAINGHPAVRFGKDNGLGTPGDRPVEISGDAAFTVFVVANLQYQEGPSHDVIVGFGEALNATNTTPGRPGAGLLEIDRTAEGRHRLDHAGGFRRDALVGRRGSYASFYDQPQVITLTKRSGPMRDTSSIFINGEPIDTEPASGTTAAPYIRHRTDFSVFLGHAHAVTGSLSGDIAEVIIYNSALTDEQRLGVEQHLVAKYGITPSLFEDHPGPEFVTNKDRQHWAFKKPVLPSVPKISRHGLWITNPIDSFLLEKLEAHGLSFSPSADAATLLRRLYLDLIGLPPSPEEIRVFIENTSLDAYEQVVDSLLHSPHFGERWGRHWLDLVGYVDVTGNDQNAEQIILGPSKWRYRDYVIRAFNSNKPWDRFLAEQIAGDELIDWRTAERFTDEHRELLIATGYLRTAIDDTHEVDLNKVPFRYQVIYDTVQIVGTSLFGLTLQCARCHDHKFDPIPQRDYYRLMALFTPALNAYAWLQPKDREVPDVSAKEQTAISQHNAEMDRRIKPFADELIALRNAATNRLLDARLMELPATNRVEVKAAFDVPAEKRNGTQKELLKRFEAKLRLTAEEIEKALSVDERDEVESLEGKVAALTKQKQTWDTMRAFFESGPPPRDFIFKRGDHEQRRERVEPGLLAVLCRSEAEAVLPKRNEAKEGSSGRRLEFARWLADTNGVAAGLHARVWMNRCWQQLFGEPLVPTPDNFGVSGLPPADPALLDWLACEFMESGWKLKRLIKLMVMSSAYRQSSTGQALNSSTVPAQSPLTVTADSPTSAAKRLNATISEQLSNVADSSSESEGAAIDPENHLLWRQRMRRLESEIVRDTILAVSGKLDKTMFGPAVPIVNLPDGSAALAPDDKMTTPTSKWRRSIYLLARRNFHLPILSSFDQPIINTTCPRRMSSSVVLQPFTMLNDAFVVEQAGHFAQRVASIASKPRARIEQAFLFALGRKPAAEEVEWSLKFLADQSANFQAGAVEESEGTRKALAALCQMLFNTSEFLYVN